MSDAPNRDPNPAGPDRPDKPILPTPAPREAATLGVPGVNVQDWSTRYNFDPGYASRIGIVIHTEVGTNQAANARFQQPNQASAHYGVAYDGSYVAQWVSEDNTAWHCGRYYPAPSYPIANTTSIGIEHEDNGQYNSPRPDGLYATSAKLVADLCRRWGIPCDRDHIRKHNEVSIVGTGCPDSLDIDRIVREAQAVLSPPKPQPSPEWRTNLMRTHYDVVLDQDAAVVDLTTGATVGTLHAGQQFVAEYVTTVSGALYRVTQYAVDHNLAHGVLASAVQPKPEWLVNLKPEASTYQLAKAVQLYDLVTITTVTKVQPGELKVGYSTTVKGVRYRLTEYSVSKSLGRGIRQADIDAAVAPPPEPPKPPTPQPPAPPEPPPGALNWFQRLLDWLAGLFGKKP